MIYALVKAFGDIVEGVELFDTEKEVEEAFFEYTGFEYNGLTNLFDEDYEETKIFVIEHQELNPDYDHTIHMERNPVVEN